MRIFSFRLFAFRVVEIPVEQMRICEGVRVMHYSLRVVVHAPRLQLVDALEPQQRNSDLLHDDQTAT